LLCLDPATDDPYIAWVEEKEVAKGEKRNFIKCLLNAGGYGLSVELNRVRFPKRKPEKLRIWAGEHELPSVMTTEFEEPGQWFFPWIGLLVTERYSESIEHKSLAPDGRSKRAESFIGSARKRIAERRSIPNSCPMKNSRDMGRAGRARALFVCRNSTKTSRIARQQSGAEYPRASFRERELERKLIASTN